ncbi:co-chaperone GroES [Nocardia arthritidis]|uniref:Co-chaperonin GroES n=1 Tax=Nocardia arthritidis TaxID=228602 RepID=A0A6G9Y755_9NOCA|nr:co-chaperone GroES [Nocardia arthritidis]
MLSACASLTTEQGSRHPRRRGYAQGQHRDQNRWSGTTVPDDRKSPESGGLNVASVNIKPLEDKILVQANEAETTTASGLVIPDTAKEKPQEGTVIAVGEGRVTDKGDRIPVDVKEGDVVIYSKYGGTEIKYQGEEYLILSARDILAVVTK